MNGQNHELEHLIAALIEGWIDEIQFHRLDEILASDPESRALYYQQLQMHTLLQFGGMSVSPAGEHSESAEAFLAHVRQASDESQWRTLPVPGAGIHLAATATTPARTNSGIRALLALAAIALVAIAYQLGVHRHQDAGAPANNGTANTVATPEAHPTGVNSLRLESGTATLSIAGVGNVAVEGPAQLDLLGPRRARLIQGRIKVQVTDPAGRGFVVETRDGEVTDLGTEFAVDVAEGRKTSLLVFDGAVDLRVPAPSSSDAKVEHLVRGDGIEFGQDGITSRIGSIFRATSPTYLRSAERESRCDEKDASPGEPIIVDVTDNLTTKETKRFYEIVAGGLREDALAFVDRVAHQWNGVDATGMPAYLIGADYVKMFNQDKTRGDVKIEVKLSRPADLYIFFDARMRVPKWLSDDFKLTGDTIGVDTGPARGSLTDLIESPIGPGNSVEDTFTIWKRTVTEPGTVTLGPNLMHRRDLYGKGKQVMGASMYGVAAVGLNRNDQLSRERVTK